MSYSFRKISDPELIIKINLIKLNNLQNPSLGKTASKYKYGWNFKLISNNFPIDLWLP